jgi:hypothetical protein
MPRSGNGEGSIRKRSDGRWEARIFLADGKRQSLYGKTRAEVVRLRNETVRQRDQGLLAQGERQSVKQFLDGWLQTARYTIKPRTWRRYTEFVQLHISPVLGAVALTKLTAQQVQHLYTRKVDEGLAASTVRQLHAVLHRALKAAVRLRLVPTNVAEMVARADYGRIELQLAIEHEKFLETKIDEDSAVRGVQAQVTTQQQGKKPVDLLNAAKRAGVGYRALVQEVLRDVNNS